jgi:hypothetical protein
MANKFYDHGIEAFLEGSIAALADTIKAALLSSASYTPNYSTDQYFSVIPGGAIIAAGVALSGKTGAAGTLSASNLTWSSVSGAQAAYICLYKDTGTSSTSPLIALIDTATGLPVTPNGGDITVAWASGQVFTLKEAVTDRDRALVETLRRLWGSVRDSRLLWLPEPSLFPAR